MVTAARSHSLRARPISAKGPGWRAALGGPSPRLGPALRARRAQSSASSGLSLTITPGPPFLPVLAQRASGAGVHPVRREVCQRLEHEAPLQDARMRDGQARLVD